MGVSGSGKTTLSQHLLAHFTSKSTNESAGANAIFLDADTFHPESNIQKMRNGIPLSDQDRFPWLYRIRDTIYAQETEWTQQQNNLAREKYIILACSCLKKIYRDVLRDPGFHLRDSVVRFVYLDVGRDVLVRRLEGREGHFFRGSAMLDSQLSTLEKPDLDDEKDVVWIQNDGDMDVDVDMLMAEIVKKLGFSCP